MNWQVGCILLTICCISSNAAIIDDFFDFFKPNPSTTNNPFQDWLATRTKRPTTTPRPTSSPGVGRCSSCACGITNSAHRIVGGQETYANKYPWIAMLRYDDKFYCGGAVINDQYILTAAHCTRGIPFSGISIRLLAHNRIEDPSLETIDLKPAEIIEHPDFDAYNYNNDVALIKLGKRLNFTNNFRPVCLAKGSETFDGKLATVIGWGAMSEGGALGKNLREVEVPIISNQVCENRHLEIFKNMLCAGYDEGEKDSCQGDSGGPLVVTKQDGRLQQVGVVSFGEGCAKPNLPGVYARVTYFYNWIRTNTRGSCYCD